MALPKLNDMPMYSVTVPSTQEEVRVRPFVVKEEKILLIAMESQDPKQIASAILDTIVSCSEGRIDSKRLTSYDVEYLFMQIRTRSVGENSEVTLACRSCNYDNPVKINIADIGVNTNVPSNRIKLTDSITISMKPPSYLEIVHSERILSEDAAPTDRLFALVIKYIDAVLTDDERIDIKDLQHEEIVEFLESMTSEQFTKIREYMENQPILKHDVNFSCGECGFQNNFTLEGLQDFF